MGDNLNLAELFLKAGLIDKDEMQIVIEANKKNPGEKISDTLVRLKFATEQDVTKVISQQFNIPFIDLSGTDIDPKAVHFIPLSLASQSNIFPVREEDNILLLAMKDPHDMEAINMAGFSSGLTIKPFLAAATQIEKMIVRYYHVEESIADYMKSIDTPQGIELITDSRMTEIDLKDLRKKSEAVPIIQMVNALIHQGITQNASDIHIEPQEKIIFVRNRIDGLLHKSLQIPKWVQPALISRIKIMSGMDISEKRVPQDGRIKIRLEEKTIDLRISCLPTQHGEKIVIRVLDTNRKLLTIGELGFQPELAGQVANVINQPQGILLVCGPTGSGKTTTLYGLLTEIAKKSHNIVTLEDPIEYVLSGVNQVQMNEKAGLTFAKSLRSVLRQDPNVIFVGEIRDSETAEIALRASMTGHLVFSTLHTNDAASTISRILDLKIEPYLVASSVTGILSQRLVRTICPHCREEHNPDRKIIKKIEDKLGEEIYFLLYHGKGCDKCQNTGYQGRMGIHELLLITPEIRESIRNQTASEGKIRQLAKQEGMKTILDDALEKVKQGMTTIEEVERVVIFAEEKDSSSYPFICPQCKKNIEKEWKTCPYCSYILLGGSGAEQTKGQGVPDSTARALINKNARVLPMPESISMPLPPHNGNNDFSGYRILLADDDEEIGRSLVMHLLKNKFAVSIATNGREALDNIAKEKPHLLLTDLVMPKMDGYELIQKVRQNKTTASLPIIVLSQKGAVEDRLKGFELGSDDYLPKPFAPDEMLFRIKAVLKRTYSI